MNGSICKVSVIISTYNMADYLEECLDSIFGQTLKDIEVVLIDDGSIDNTDSIVKAYERRYSNLISYRQENQGAGKARNYGVLLSNGEFMIFMDADDRYPRKDCLERLYVEAKKHNVLICGGNMIYNDNGIIRNRYSAGEGDVNHIKNGVINVRDYFYLYGHTRYLFKASFIKANQVEYAGYVNYEDQVFTMNALGLAQCFYELDYPVYEHRINHKQRKMDSGVLYDTLCGFRDTLKLIIKYNMRLMFEKNYIRFVQSYMHLIAQFTSCGNMKFEKVIWDINNLVEKSGWNYDEKYIISFQQIMEYRRNMEKAEEALNQLFLKSSPIIIYGAGKNTSRLISAYKTQMKNIVGIAVSKIEDNPSECEGIPVRNIEYYKSYKEVAVVLITPSFKIKEEIADILESMGFKNYEWVDMRMIKRICT